MAEEKTHKQDGRLSQSPPPLRPRLLLLDRLVAACAQGEALFEVLDAIEPSCRDPFAPFRMPIMDRYRQGSHASTSQSLDAVQESLRH